MKTKDFQNKLTTYLKLKFGDSNVESEWRAFAGESFYGPVPDIAVGPFSIRAGSLAEAYTAEYVKHKELIQSLVAINNVNAEKHDTASVIDAGFEFPSNQNARCFICFEIENNVSTKHIIGGLVNASALGRIALLVGWDEKKVGTMFRQRRYMRELQNLHKLNFYTENVLIVSTSQLNMLIDDHDN